jgi:hypothetical protein
VNTAAAHVIKYSIHESLQLWYETHPRLLKSYKKNNDLVRDGLLLTLSDIPVRPEPKT